MSLSFRFGTVGKPISTPKKPGGSTHSPAAFRPRPLPGRARVGFKEMVNCRQVGMVLGGCDNTKVIFYVRYGV